MPLLSCIQARSQRGGRGGAMAPPLKILAPPLEMLAPLLEMLAPHWKCGGHHWKCWPLKFAPLINLH